MRHFRPIQAHLHAESCGKLRLTARLAHAKLDLFPCLAEMECCADLAKHEDLMELLRDDLWHALYQAVKTSQLSNFVAAGQVLLYLWIYLGDHLLLQLEAFLRIFLLWLSRGSKSLLFQEAALEVKFYSCQSAADHDAQSTVSVEDDEVQEAIHSPAQFTADLVSHARPSSDHE